MLKKLKSLFIEEDASTEKEPAIAPPKIKKASPSDDVAIPNTQSEKAPAGKITNKFMNVLLGAMDKNNLEGFDYLEFKQSLRSLEKMNMDEATRYQSAFAMAKTMGATSDNLMQSAGHYIQILNKEEAKFAQALKNQRTKQIGDKEQYIQNTSKVIKQKMAKIEQLQKEIANHKKELGSVEKEINGAKVKLETTNNNFHVTYDLLVNKIKQDVQNIKQYLKG